MNAPATFFGKTRILPIRVFRDSQPVPDADHWDDTLWTERGEDWYALGNRQWKGKLIRVVERRDWLRAKDISE